MVIATHEACIKVMEKIKVPPPTYGQDITREKLCARCRTTYMDIFPSFLVDTVRKRGCSTIWDRFQNEIGHCDACQKAIEAERRQEERARCVEKQKQARVKDWESMCPASYRKTQEHLLPVASAEQRKKVLAWKFGPKGLLMPGPTGSGKTRTAYMLLKRLFIEDGLSVRMFDCVAFAHEVNRRAMENESFDGWAKKLSEADVVFIDDLGKTRFSERVEVELFGLIERRTSWERPLIVTTNDDGDSLRARMSQDRGEPMIRRLREFCEIIPFK